jgi:hypothetical protein
LWTRPRQPADQRDNNAHLFGAICSARDVEATLALPYGDAAMIQFRLDETSCNVAVGVHEFASSTAPHGTPRSSSTWPTSEHVDPLPSRKHRL